MSTIKVGLAVSRKGKTEGAKPFYYNVGIGQVADNNGEKFIEITTLPGVSVGGGMIKVEKDKQFPSTFPERMDVKVVVCTPSPDGKSTSSREHLIGTAFAVQGKEGIYSLSFPDELSFSGRFVITIPKPR